MRKLLITVFLAILFIAFFSKDASAPSITKYMGATSITSMGGSDNRNYTDNAPVLWTSTVKYAKTVEKYAFGPGSSGTPTRTGDPDSGTPIGYGWVTEYNFSGNIHPGTWNFSVNITSSTPDTGYIGFVAYKRCNAVDTMLFSTFNDTDVLDGSANPVIYTHSYSAPLFYVNNCSLKVEYWINVTATPVQDSQATVTMNHDSSSWIQFPPPDNILPTIYIDSPQNTTYLIKTIDLNVSADEEIIKWFYSINDTSNNTFTPNETITVSAGQNNITVYANDTAGNINFSRVYFTLNTTLDVNLFEPSVLSSTNIIQNTTFLVNATVICREGSCGNVAGTVLYNASSQDPDTPISVTYGAEPLFVNESSPTSTKSCNDNPLSEGEFCNITWIINATDSTLSSWKIGVNFSSSSGWSAPNTTDSATISVTPCAIDITVNWNSIEFGGLLTPNTYENPASGNTNQLYNITINEGSCNTDLYIKGTNIENSTLGYVFGVGNLTWSNTSNDYAASYNMTEIYEPLKLNVPSLTNVTTWYWINVPPIFAANYNGTVFIEGVENGEPAP